ncbi:MAG: hypothetical protein QMC81_02995, partial [Thermoanaerobacterales bacterium]|nr:hypothetical protein [Thermoanaerobacterales bacterium]
MRSTRAILLLSGVLMFMVLGLLGTTTPVAYAVVSEEHVLTNLGSYTLIGQGGRNPHEYQLVATGIPHGNNHITYVKYRVRCNSSYRSSAASLYLAHVGGNPQYDPVAELVNNGDPILALPCSVSSSSTKGQWYTYERTVTSSEGRGNRNIYLFARGEDDAYFSYTFEILEVRYVEYFWDDIVVELTPERYVKITASRNPGIGQTKTELVNLTDGRTIPVT